MSATVNMYPTLTIEQINTIGYESDAPELIYKDNHDFFPLNLENINGDDFDFVAEIRDPRCEWYPEKYNLMLKKTIRINNCHDLFGPSGLVPVDSVLGIALRWMSAKSGYRGFLPFGEISQTCKNSTFNYEYVFEKNSLRGSITLETILYIKSCKKCGTDEQHLAQQSGTVLGILDSCELFLDGNGSIFPVSTVSDTTKPLWWVYYDDTCDPLQDPFDEEFVELRLNKAHPAYEYLRIDENLKDSPLFLERTVRRHYYQTAPDSRFFM